MRHAVRFTHGARHYSSQITAVHGHAVDDQPQMQHDKAHENGQKNHDGFAHAAEVEACHQHDQDQLGGELEFLRADRQQTKESIDTAGKRGRHRQYVVDQQRRTGHQPRTRPQQRSRNPVAAATGREQFDHLVIAERDDEHGCRGGQREEQRELGVLAKREERFFRPVARGRQTVGAESHPREYRRDRDCVAGAGIERVEGFAEEQLPHPVDRCHGVSSRGMSSTDYALEM